jgi:hypothetical protein
MGKEKHSDDMTVTNKGASVPLIAGIVGGAIVLLTCCCSISIVAFFVGRESAREWEYAVKWYDVNDTSMLAKQLEVMGSAGV